LDGPRGRNAGALKKFFRENFAAFQPGSGLRRTDEAETLASEFIRNACDQGGFRADDRKIHLFGFGQPGVSGDGLGRGHTAGDLRNARIAWGGDQFYA
jgi:hypothetical protein